MSLIALTAAHHHVSLRLLEQLSAGADEVGRTLLERVEPVRGVITLSTCNRFELYADVASDPDETTLRHAGRALARLLAETSGVAAPQAQQALTLLAGHAVAEHLFTVTAGLDSMVVGEREIAGQVKRSLASARAAGTTSKDLERLFQAAVRTAKKVASETAVSATGRSLVDIGLDLAGGGATRWPTLRTLLVGTGAYAGAVVTALQRRHAATLRVWSSSGRAPDFAQRHAVAAVPAGAQALGEALAWADLIVTVSGQTGRDRPDTTEAVPPLGPGAQPAPTYTLSAALLAAARPAGRPLTVLDLALQRDVDPAVADLPGVRLFDLAALQPHVPAADRTAVEQARAIVTAAAAAFATEQAARLADHAVAALAAEAERQIAAELAVRLLGDGPGHPGPGADEAETIALEIRRRVKADLHQRIVALRHATLAAALASPAAPSITLLPPASGAALPVGSSVPLTPA